MWGDQWICPNCGWHNNFLRLKCRECRRPIDDQAKTETSMGILAGVKARKPSDDCCLNFGCPEPETCNSLGRSCGTPQ